MMTEHEFETEIDSAEWGVPRKVRVEAKVDERADEIGDILVRDAATDEELTLTPDQERGIIEEIWDAVRQDEHY